MLIDRLFPDLFPPDKKEDPDANSDTVIWKVSLAII